jgi:ferredoxin
MEELALLLPTSVLAPSRILQLYDISVNDEKCTLCEVCTSVCPVGALMLQTDGDLKLGFTPTLCTGCNLCTDGCPEQAITLMESVVLPEALQPRIMKAGGRVQRCKHCNAELESEFVVARVRHLLGSQETGANADWVSLCEACKRQAIVPAALS